MSNKINKVQAEREEKLQQAMDYSSEQALKDIKQEFKETIYYKGYAYTFDENGFIDKEEITDNSYLEKSNDVLIKEIPELKLNKIGDLLNKLLIKCIYKPYYNKEDTLIILAKNIVSKNKKIYLEN